MNGRNHENYAYSTDEGDETNDTDLRFRTPVMSCLWCQELVALRIWEKTGQLVRPDDPADVNQKGLMWYSRWVDEIRQLYWKFFDLPFQILEREKIYAHPENYPDAATFEELKGSRGRFRPLDVSNLYQPFEAPALTQAPATSGTDDEELLMANA